MRRITHTLKRQSSSYESLDLLLFRALQIRKPDASRNLPAFFKQVVCNNVGVYLFVQGSNGAIGIVAKNSVFSDFTEIVITVSDPHSLNQVINDRNEDRLTQ